MDIFYPLVKHSEVFYNEKSLTIYEKKNSLIVFESESVRRIWHNNEWFFSVVDVVRALTNSPTPRQYWGKVKDRGFKSLELSPIWVQLKLPAQDGKLRETDCANTESLFRIIQSIPSKKAEPFKRWLAKVGSERIEEIENPERGQDRIKRYYEMKGYPKSWIDKRLRGIAIRQELTDEWKQRDIKGKEYAILTDEISQATFGKSVKEYKDFKGLQRGNQNLRDNMTDLELIFTMLGEASTLPSPQKEVHKVLMNVKNQLRKEEMLHEEQEKI